jgi:molecular chaperone DnaJ
MASSTNRDYYELLGVPRDASPDDVRNAYRRLAKQYHPDLNKHDGAEDKFKEINEAYSVLSDTERRSIYDRFGHAGLNGMAGGAGPGYDDLGEIFSEFFRGFGMGGSGRQRRSPRRGADLQAQVELTFDEAVFGVEKEIEIHRQEVCSSCKGSRAEPGSQPVRCPACKGTGEERQVHQTFLGSMVNVTTCSQCGGSGEIIHTPCKTCRGLGLEQKNRTLQVPIPPGVDSGTQIRLAGEGGPGLFGGPQGNLYVAIRVKAHELIRRRGNDIWVELGIDYAQAALGADVQFRVLDNDINLRLPAGTQPGQLFRVRGKGVPRLQQNGRGDLMVVVTVRVPTTLSGDQKKVLRQMADAVENAPKLQKTTMFDNIQDLFRE